MKKHTIPLTAAAGGLAALLLRLWQNRTGFEADTGLPVPGAPAGIALAAWLLAVTAALVLLVCRLPRETGDGPAFPQAFLSENSLLLMLALAGVCLMAASGGLDLAAGLGGPDDGGTMLLSTTAGVRVSSKGQLLMGALALLSAAALFPAVLFCKRGVRRGASFPGVLLLAPPVCLVVRMVLVYRIDSVDPALEAYYVELLALTLMTLAFYRLSSFAYQAGRTRRFALYAACAVVLCLAALGDGGLSEALFYAGGGLALLGFLLLRLTAGTAGEAAAEKA